MPDTDRTPGLTPKKPQHALNDTGASRYTTVPLVGLGRVELPTSRLSGVRSNHLSYRPPPHSQSLRRLGERGSPSSSKSSSRSS